MYYLLTNISGSTLTLEDLNGDGIKKEAQEKIAKSRGSMAWLHFANVPGDPTSAVCNSCQVGATLHNVKNTLPLKTMKNNLVLKKIYHFKVL